MALEVIRHFTNEWKTIRERLAAQNVPLERTTFGSWVIVFETLAKSIWRDVSRDDDARAHWCGLLAIDDWTLIEAMIFSKMVTLLKEVNQLRNVARHGGALTERDAELRESLLTSALLKFRQGSHHTRVHLVMGTRSPFQQREFALRHPLGAMLNRPGFAGGS